MSERLEARAETQKLARLLHAGESELAFVAELPPGAVREFRGLATDHLHSASAEAMRIVAAAARVLPGAVVALIAQRAFGPLLTARAAASVDPGKAREVVRRLPAEFVADVAVHIDPRRVAGLLRDIEVPTVVAVGRILAARGEYVSMGQFLSYLPAQALAASIEVLPPEVILRTAFVLEDKARVDETIALLGPARLQAVIACAAREHLWPEALDLLGHLSEARRAPIAQIVAGLAPAEVAELVRAVSDAGLWEGLLPLVPVLDVESRERLAGLPAFHEPSVLGDIVECATRPGSGLWRDLAPLLDALPSEPRACVAEIVAGLDAERLAELAHAVARAPETLDTLLRLAGDMDATGRRRVGELIETAPQAGEPA